MTTVNSPSQIPPIPLCNSGPIIINDNEQNQVIQSGSSNNSYSINDAFNDYTKRFNKFIKIYSLLHLAAYIFFNLVIIILQIVLTVALSTNKYGNTASIYNIYSGFWSGGFNIILAIISFPLVAFMNYYFLTTLVTLYFLSIFITIFGLILTNLLGILFMSSCSLCIINNAIPIYWALFALGIVSALLGGLFFVLGLIVIGSSNDKFNKKSIREKNYSGEFYNNPFAICPLFKRGF